VRPSVAILVAALAVALLGVALGSALRPFGGPPTAQEQVLAIAADLRCPVCTGESAAAANTPEAQAMRAQIQSDLRAGMSRREILDAFQAEYGTWILYRPPVRGAFLLLWILPAAAVVGAGVGLLRLAARGGSRPAPEAPAPADPEAPDVRARLSRFL
jgi:cytochrome c-type biogenesis protein CcmH